MFWWNMVLNFKFDYLLLVNSFSETLQPDQDMIDACVFAAFSLQEWVFVKGPPE